VLAGKQKVEGLNVGGAGTLVGTWKVIGSYTLMRSRIDEHTNKFLVGQALPSTPEQSLSLWSTVSIADKLSLGGGTVFQSETAINNPANATTALNKVPSFWRFDAFASYNALRNLDLQLNVSNLTNALYYEQYAGSRAVPTEGRVVLVSAKMRI
jgi:catecholate siderophore receptor